MWGNTVEPGRPQVTIWRRRFACRITKATNTHSEYVIFITFPPQQWLNERASLLRYTYIGCLVLIDFFPVCFVSSLSVKYISLSAHFLHVHCELSECPIQNTCGCETS